MQALRRHLVAALFTGPLAARAAAIGKPSGPVVLSLHSRGAAVAEFDMPMLERLAQHSVVTETPWYNGPRTFSGPLLREVLGVAGVTSGERARLVALNDYHVELPLDDVRRHDVILARLLDGRPMTVREKGPLFVMYPFDKEPALRSSQYFARCVWQLKAIELL